MVSVHVSYDALKVNWSAIFLGSLITSKLEGSTVAVYITVNHCIPAGLKDQFPALLLVEFVTEVILQEAELCLSRSN